MLLWAQYMRRILKQIRELSLVAKLAMVLAFVSLSGGAVYALNATGQAESVSPESTSSKNVETSKDSASSNYSEVQGASLNNSDQSANENNPAVSGSSTTTSQSTYDRTAQDKEAAARSEADRQYMAKLEAEDKARQLASCTSSKKVLMDGYPVYIGQIESAHSRNLSSISSSYASRGLSFSGMAQADIQAENTRYQNELSNYQNTYQQKLASFDC